MSAPHNHLVELAREWQSEAAALRSRIQSHPHDGYSKLHGRALTVGERTVRAEELEGCSKDLLMILGEPVKLPPPPVGIPLGDGRYGAVCGVCAHEFTTSSNPPESICGECDWGP